MRNKNGGLTSTTVKDRYNKKTYEQVNFRLKKDTFPTRDEIEEAAQEAGQSLNAWIVEAIMDRLEQKKGTYIKDIQDVEAYARSAGMTEEEYIKAAILEKMERQDREYTETVTREKIDDI